MVELRVDVAEERLPEDCFISVRVGETQKLSRIAASRSYQFPKAGERRYGKIEIYRRIGTVGVDVDPMNSGDRQVSVGCGDFGSLKLRVAVSESGKGPTQAAREAPVKDEIESSKSKAAKEYLRQHSLELQLSEAMQAVLRARPDNPVQFLAEKLLANVGLGAVALAQKVSAPPAATGKTPATPQADLSDFKGYFSANFGTAPKAAWDKIYSKFPARSAPAGAGAVATRAPAAAPPEANLANFKGYFAANFGTAPKAAWDKIYSKFPAKGPTTATATAAPAAAASTSTAPFQLRPSVGSWLAPRPKQVTPVPSKAKTFARMPSVGTWLQPLPVDDASKAKQAAAAPSAAAPAAASRDFKLKPSVGTWLSKPAQLHAPGASKAVTAHDLGVPTNYPLPQQAHCVSSGAFGPMFSNLGLAPRMIFV